MTYDIYFHNDFDGRASAAVVLAFLESRGDSIEHFTPVNFDLTEQWLDTKFFEKHTLFRGNRNPAIIVDFLFHPASALWFDHHPTTFKSEAYRKMYAPDKFHQLNPGYASNCHFVYDALRKDFGWKPPAHMKELVHWLDIIDGAQYKNAEQTIVIKEPALEIDAYIDKTHDDLVKSTHLIKLFATTSFEKIAAQREIQRAAKLTRKENLKGLRYYKKHIAIFGDATLIDLTNTDIPTLRYAPYYLFPKIYYGMRMTKRGKLYHIGIGANPWIKGAAMKGHKEVHIGELLRTYGGGGHKGAGACEFKTKRDLKRAAQEIIPLLNN